MPPILLVILIMVGAFALSALFALGMRQRFLAILAILAGIVISIMLLKARKPEPQRAEAQAAVPSVQVIAPEPQDIAPTLRTQGLVEPATATLIAAEIAGAVIEVSGAFEIGAVLPAGGMLLRADDADYQAALAASRAEIAAARLALAQEEARAAQALRDWSRLGKQGAPPPLVVRTPQMEAVRARIAAAEAAERKALRDIERCVIRAPYRCLVMEKQADLGDLLAPGRAVAQVQTADAPEIRLPLPLDEFALIGWDPAADPPTCRVFTLEGGAGAGWPARILRTEGRVNSATRTIRLMARIETDAGSPDTPPLTGQFLRAEIQAAVPLRAVFRLPQSALHGADAILALDGENRIRIRPAQLLRNEGGDVLARAELQPGDRIIISPVETPIDGMPARLADAAAAKAPR